MKQDGLGKMKPERLILNIKSHIFCYNSQQIVLQETKGGKKKPADSKYITIKIVSSLDKSPMTGWLFLWITSDATGTCKHHMNKEKTCKI